MKIYCDSGYSFNESTADNAAKFARNVYNSKTWNISPSAVLTDKPSNTYVRAPGSTQGHAAIEVVMEHLADTLGLDPLEFRMINMMGQNKQHPIQEIVKNLRDSSKFDDRNAAAEKFNQVQNL